MLMSWRERLTCCLESRGSKSECISILGRRRPEFYGRGSSITITRLLLFYVLKNITCHDVANYFFNHVTSVCNYFVIYLEVKAMYVQVLLYFDIAQHCVKSIVMTYICICNVHIICSFIQLKRNLRLKSS